MFHLYFAKFQSIKSINKFLRWPK